MKEELSGVFPSRWTKDCAGCAFEKGVKNANNTGGDEYSRCEEFEKLIRDNISHLREAAQNLLAGLREDQNCPVLSSDNNAQALSEALERLNDPNVAKIRKQLHEDYAAPLSPEND